MFIRRARPEDEAAITLVHTAAFANVDVAEPAEARLVTELAADGAIVTALNLVAEVDGELAGHVVCSRGTLAGSAVVGLGPIGVLPDHQGRGVGSALMHAVVAAADALDEPMIVLLGAPAFYARFGFEVASDLGITPTDPEWTPYLQVRRLHAYRAELRGTYHYADAFDRL